MERTFEITSASSTSLIFVALVSIFFILLIGLFVFVGYSARNTKFEVTDQGLRIKGGIYGRFIHNEEIIGENVKIVDLNADLEYKPRIRTNGIGLPGYSEGWFKQKNKEKALLFVTDRSNVVYIPTKQDYSVLLSASDPEEFYQATKQWK
jgi:uncharacterized membrane protein YbhN (UPF0104 family)|tara:strand:- start:138 stop:587 length:450 start_codon:yes stop_codon:yes gene_type:complete